jgi:hypothetical protein
MTEYKKTSNFRNIKMKEFRKFLIFFLEKFNKIEVRIFKVVFPYLVFSEWS